MIRLDDILGYGLKIYQDSDFFSFSLDSVILGNYSTIRLRDKKILDFCSGNGIVSFIVSLRTKSSIDGVEIQEKLYDLAIKSKNYNHLDDRINFYCSDIKDYSNLHNDSYDLVLCNPPYFKVQDSNYFNLSYEKRVARHEIFLKLDELCECSFKVLKENGILSIVHRSDRLMDILTEMKNHRIEPKRIKFIYDNIDKPSNLILVEGVKLGRVGLKIDKPLILYNNDGSMSDEYSLLQKEVIK